MYFRLLGIIEGGFTSARADSPANAVASFRVPALHAGIDVHLGRVIVNDGRARTPFRAEIEIQPPPDVAECFRLLADDRLVTAADLSNDDDAWLRRHIDGDRIAPGFVVPVRFLTSSFREFVTPLEASLREATFRVVRVIRWVYGLPGLAEPLTVTSREWSPDAHEWESLPYEQPKPSRGYITREPLADGDEIAAIQRLLDTGADEPVGRLLWLVASANRHREPRASLAMAAAAAEVGMRHALNARVSRQKLREMHVKDLLGEVMMLSIVVAVAGDLPLVAPPERLRNRILLTAAQRNALVHRGDFRLRPAEMDDLLNAAENLLWILDYLGGYRVAIHRVTVDVLAEIGSLSGLSPGDLLRAVTS